MMSFYITTILIGLILLLINIFILKHSWVAEYSQDSSDRIFKKLDIPLWLCFMGFIFVLIPVIGQIFLFATALSFRIALESYELFSLTNLKGLSWYDYENKTSKYMERYNKPSLFQKFCRLLNKFFNYNINR